MREPARGFGRRAAIARFGAAARAGRPLARAWRRKRTAYAAPAGLLHFVANSHWLADQARQSSLVAGYPVSVIHLCLDLDVFRPLDRRVARDVLRIPPDCRVVCFAAAGVDNERKGMRSWSRPWPPCNPNPSCSRGPGISAGVGGLAAPAPGQRLQRAPPGAGLRRGRPVRHAFFGRGLWTDRPGSDRLRHTGRGLCSGRHSRYVRHESTGLLVPVGDGAGVSGSPRPPALECGSSRGTRPGGPRRPRRSSPTSATPALYQELYTELLKRSGRSVARNSFGASSVTRNLFR